MSIINLKRSQTRPSSAPASALSRACKIQLQEPLSCRHPLLHLRVHLTNYKDIEFSHFVGKYRHLGMQLETEIVKSTLRTT